MHSTSLKKTLPYSGPQKSDGGGFNSFYWKLASRVLIVWTFLVTIWVLVLIILVVVHRDEIGSSNSSNIEETQAPRTGTRLPEVANSSLKPTNLPVQNPPENPTARPSASAQSSKQRPTLTPTPWFPTNCFKNDVVCDSPCITIELRLMMVVNNTVFFRLQNQNTAAIAADFSRDPVMPSSDGNVFFYQLVCPSSCYDFELSDRSGDGIQGYWLSFNASLVATGEVGANTTVRQTMGDHQACIKSLARTHGPSSQPTPIPSSQPTPMPSNPPTISPAPTHTPTPSMVPTILSMVPSSPAPCYQDDVSCTSSQCATARLTLTTDSFPEETSLSLTNQETGAVAWPTNDMTIGQIKPENTYNFTAALCPTECYIFQIRDTNGDGICCNWGEGSFVLQYNGQEVLSGSSFGILSEISMGEACGLEAQSDQSSGVPSSAPGSNTPMPSLTKSPVTTGGPSSTAPSALDSAIESQVPSLASTGASTTGPSAVDISFTTSGAPSIAEGSIATNALTTAPSATGMTASTSPSMASDNASGTSEPSLLEIGMATTNAPSAVNAATGMAASSDPSLADDGIGTNAPLSMPPSNMPDIAISSNGPSLSDDTLATSAAPFIASAATKMVASTSPSAPTTATGATGNSASGVASLAPSAARQP